jgi:2,4-dienoyl-CoA reductase-like NADH-dependent reductase (Old Yellow Enzyme family)
MPRHERFRFSDRESLLEKARALGVGIPFSDDLAPLLEPVDVGGRRLSNRFAIQPMEGADADAEGAPGELTFRRYERFARGGSSLLWFEATAVLPEARSNPAQLCLTDGNVESFGRLADAARRAARESMGTNHEPLLVLQLTHPGRHCRSGGERRPVVAQRNPALDAAQGIAPDHPLAGDAELDRIQEALAAAARRAADAGFDGVDVKACHGYLVSELLAAFGREESRYGGAFENRSRFLLETVRRIRETVPGLLVASRINAFDGLPRPYGFGARGAGGDGAPTPDLAEPMELVRRLESAGCGLLNASLGIPTFNAHLGRPFDKALPGQDLPDEHPLEVVARHLKTTAALQAAAPMTPFVGTAYSWLRHLFPGVAAAAVAAGQTALVGVGRMAFAYPGFAKDLMEKGALDPDRVCIACSGCSRLLREGRHAGCVVRDKEVYTLRRPGAESEG